MTEAFDPAGVDYARAIEEASAFLASRRDADKPAASGPRLCWGAQLQNADIRYPMPALDPTRR